jgi:hypothetical protein
MKAEDVEPLQVKRGRRESALQHSVDLLRGRVHADLDTL